MEAIYNIVNRIPAPLLVAILYVEHSRLYKQYMTNICWEKVKMVGTFCDAHCTDNLATQIAKKYGIKTFTLQHGQYRILRPEYENADAEIYKNFISDLLLAWGEATINEFEKYGIDRKRLSAVGALRNFSFNKKMDTVVNNSVFGVILCADTYVPTNVGMIKIANEIAKTFNMKYFLRFHPRNNIDIYMKYVEDKLFAGSSSNIGNEEYAEKVTFSIIHMTGVFVEMLSINSPVFVYNDQYLEDVFRIEEFSFKDVEEFQVLYKKFKNKMEILKDKQYSYYKYFNNCDSLEDNYKNILRELERYT